MVLILILAFSACSRISPQRKVRPQADYTPEPVSTIPVHKYEGSLWRERDAQSLLFADHKAREVNDLVTVLVVESAKAKGTSSTNTTKDSSYSAEVSELFGLPSSLGIKSFLGSGEPFQPKIGGSAKSDFQGQGDTAREGTLTATITARVVQVYPNGNMKIVGTREVTINNDTQYLVLTGIIRREDISSSNVISSDHISGAKIEYYGEGILADKDSPGWLTRTVDWLWPF